MIEETRPLPSSEFMQKLRELRSFSTMRLAGISVLTRYFGFQDPREEFLVFESLKELDSFVAVQCGGRAQILKENGCHQSLFCGKRVNLFTAIQFSRFIFSSVDNILYDISTDTLSYDTNVKASIQSKKVKLFRLYEAPESFFRGMNYLCCLPGFGLEDNNIDYRIVFGNIQSSPINRFRRPEIKGQDCITSPGCKMIVNFIMNCFTMSRIPADLFAGLSNAIYASERFDNFDQFCFNPILDLLPNVEENIATLGITEPVYARFAALLSPAFEYSEKNPSDAVHYCTNLKTSESYQNFKNRNVNIHNMCPFGFWFWTCFHNMPGDVVLRSLQVYSAFIKLSEGVSAPCMAFAYAPMFWRDVIALADPAKCKSMMEEIESSRKFDISEKEIKEIHRWCMLKTSNVQQMRATMYTWLEQNPNATLDDYREFRKRDRCIMKSNKPKT